MSLAGEREPAWLARFAAAWDAERRAAGLPARAFSLEQRMRALKTADALFVRTGRASVLARVRAAWFRRGVPLPPARPREGRPRSHRPAGGTRCRSPGGDDPEPPLVELGRAA